MLQCSWLFSARNHLASKYFLTNKFIYSIYIPFPVRCVNLASVVVHVQAISMACSQGLSTCLNHYLPPSTADVVRCALYTWSTDSAALYICSLFLFCTHAPFKVFLYSHHVLSAPYMFSSLQVLLCTSIPSPGSHSFPFDKTTSFVSKLLHVSIFEDLL